MTGRAWDGRWVERVLDDLESVVTVPSEVLADRVRARGRCQSVPDGEPPAPPPDEPAPDRWLAEWTCAGCPVRPDCLELELREAGTATTGVWGGLAEDDRRALVAPWQAHPARAEWDDTAREDDDQDGGQER